MHRASAVAVAAAAILAVVLAGCARGGEGQEPVVPHQVIDIVVRYARPINDAFYYFIAIDGDNDPNDGPVPVASGPYWGNGWGTGSMTHYVEYHQGQYQLFRVVLDPELTRAGGGIVDVSGTPDITDAGVAVVDIRAINFGRPTVSGSGMVTGVVNDSCQNAGTLTLATDASGRTVAGSVRFTPAADGGRALTADEQAAIDALNAGGVALAADSLAALGLTLQLSAPAAGQQTITIPPAIADVRVTFTTSSPPQQQRSWDATLRANSRTPTDNPPFDGMVIVTGDLVAGQSAEIRLVPARGGQLIGPPYDYALPNGSDTLRVTLDLSKVAPGCDWITLNFISTTELLFDPQATDADNVYDANGVTGNTYVNIRLGEFGTYRNGDRWEKEGADDPTLEGPASEADKASVDLVDWQVTVRRL